MRPNRLVGLALPLVLAACWLHCGGQSRTPSGSSDAVINVQCSVRDARVVINDRELGSVAQLRRGIALSPGRHRLVVKHESYHSHFAELTLTRREKRVIVVELAERFE